MDNSPVSHGHKDNKLDILELFKGAIKSDGSLDLRSTFGRSLRAIQEEIDKDQEEAARAILKRDIAFYAVLQKIAESYILAHPESIFTDQGINPLLSKDLLKIQQLKRMALNNLLDMKKKGKRGGKRPKDGRDLDSIEFI